MEREQEPSGIAEIESKRDVRIEILGSKYYISREDLVHLLHGYKSRIHIHEKTE